MRSRASGFAGKQLVDRSYSSDAAPVTSIGRTDLLDERDLVLGRCRTWRTGPRRSTCAIQSWIGHERVDLARGVLGDLRSRDQEASQPARQVRQDALGLGLRFEEARCTGRSRMTCSAGLTDERRAEDPVRVGVPVAGPRRGAADEDLPRVDQVDARRDLVRGDVADAAVLVDAQVAGCLASPCPGSRFGARMASSELTRRSNASSSGSETEAVCPSRLQSPS